MASFFNNLGNSIGNGINSSINWVDNTGIGGFFTNTLNSTSNFLSGLSNIPAVFGNLVNGIANKNKDSYILDIHHQINPIIIKR